ncbi:MAG: ROK family protein [Pseudomonadota bacterium]
MTDQTSNLRLGIDFGGTKTEIIGLDAHNGKELYRKRIPTARDDYQGTLNAFKGLIEEAEKNLGTKGSVGMGIPGSISFDTGTVKNSNSTWMNGKPLKEDLEKIMSREIHIQNDANCFAVSEATDGAAQGAKVVFGVIIGTGCGGGVVFDGKPVKGVNGIGGEWGHNPLPNPRIYVPKGTPIAHFDGLLENEENPYPFITHDPDWNEMPGPVCFCGRRGCQELWLSGTGFKLDYKRVTGEDLSTHDVISNAREGEPKAVAALERYVDRLARALGNVINLIDPEVIVLGGGMSNVAALYEEVPKIWNKYIFSDFVHTKLKSPIHGDSSGVRGAAWLWGKAS